MRRPWGRRSGRRAEEAARAEELARIEAQNAEARARAHSTAEELWEAYSRLLASVEEPLGRRFLAALQASWALEHRVEAPSPTAPVLADVLRRLGSEPDPAALEGYVAADHRMSRTTRYEGPGPDAEAAFVAELAEEVEVPGWLEEHRCTARPMFDEKRHTLEASLGEATGRPRQVTPVTTSVRWWPGRPIQEPQLRIDPLQVYALHRSLEHRGDLVGWEEPWAQLADLSLKAEGLPPFDPVDWLLASWAERPRRLGGLEIGGGSR